VHVIVDFLGGLAYDLVLWMSSKYCTSQVRERLVYVRPSDASVTLTLNPLLYDDYDQGFFKVNRRRNSSSARGARRTCPSNRAWPAGSITPFGPVPLGLTVADTEHLLLPGSKFHARSSTRCRNDCDLSGTSAGRPCSEATRILDSTRNRMKPFHDSGILRRSSAASSIARRRAVHAGREDCHSRSFAAGPVVPPEANAIAGLIVNEFLAAARSLPRTIRYPTYLWLDEFQRLVSPDLEYAIPEMRQLGIRLILAHQSFSQLKTKDTDLTSLIFQPQTRIAFGEQGLDAEILADEFASIMFNRVDQRGTLFASADSGRP